MSTLETPATPATSTDFFDIPNLSNSLEQSELEQSEPGTCSTCKSLKRTDFECHDGWIAIPSPNDPINPETGLSIYEPRMGRCRQWQAHLTSERAQFASGGLHDPRYVANWNELILTHKSWLAVYALSKRIELVLEHGLNLILAGPTGRGKTHAAVLLCRDAVAQGKSAVKASWPDVLASIRDTYNRKAELTERQILEPLVNADLLLLDDVGAGGTDQDNTGKNFSRSKLEDVISRRYDAGRASILTVNFNARDLEQIVGQRVASRLQGRFMPISFDGPEYRSKAEPLAVKELIQDVWHDVMQAGKPSNQP